MEEFFDYLLGLLLVVLLAIIGLLLYFSIRAPLIAYFLAGAFLTICAGVVGFLIRSALQKKRLGSYYPLLLSISQSYKDVNKAFRKLDRHARKGLRSLYPKIKELRQVARASIWRIYDIDKTLKKLESQHPHSSHLNSAMDDRMIESHKRYYEHIQTIETLRTKYLQEIQEALQFLQSLHAQLAAFRYAPNYTEMQNKLSETLDELLVTMKALDDVG